MRDPNVLLGRHLAEEHFDSSYAPYGWQGRADGSVSTTTDGNNVKATKPGEYPPKATNGVFDFPIDLSRSPTSYVEACSTQLYYTINWLHDVMYQHGFDEKRLVLFSVSV